MVTQYLSFLLSIIRPASYGEPNYYLTTAEDLNARLREFGFNYIIEHHLGTWLGNHGFDGYASKIFKNSKNAWTGKKSWEIAFIVPPSELPAIAKKYNHLIAEALLIDKMKHL